METPKVPTCYERWCKAILPSSFSFSKEELPLNLPVFLTLPQHSKAICPQSEQLGFFVPFPMAMTYFPTILEISVKTNISFLTPPLGGQLPTSLSVSPTRKVWSTVLVSVAPVRHDSTKCLSLRGHFHVLDLCLKISDKDKGGVVGYSDTACVLWANSSASLLPFLPPKASYSALSSWRSVTITLIDTGFLKVTSQALYLTSLPTFSTAFDTFDNSLPPSCHTTTPPIPTPALLGNSPLLPSVDFSETLPLPLSSSVGAIHTAPLLILWNICRTTLWSSLQAHSSVAWIPLSLLVDPGLGSRSPLSPS